MALTNRKILLIEGGSQGIGAAAARVLVEKDHFAVINYSSNTATATNLVEELGATNAVAMKADASLISDTNTMDISETPENGFDSLFAINVKGPYCLAQRVRVLVKTLGPKSVSIDAVAPGPTATNLFLNSGRPQAVLDKIASFSPHNRIGDPKDVAEAIVFLTQNTGVSGQVVKVNGGMA
ncbi:hypothetical protein E4T39_01085 [Aureobasidium subglaciale]|nr:hypothetical protein E4T39_01085 [Aureobasidium subglaciale]